MASRRDCNESIRNRNEAMPVVRRAAAWAICLVSLSGALGDEPNTGWHFSRANCLLANESITWKMHLTPDAIQSVLGQVIPGTGWTGGGIPAFRRTTSVHRHTHDSSKDHTHQSSYGLEWTWRAHAGSFPVPEAYPYIAIGVRWVVVWDWDWDWDWGIGPQGAPIFVRPELITFLDPAPWVVRGTHYERTSVGAAMITKATYATGCNWGDTFNSMGG